MTSPETCGKTVNPEVFYKKLLLFVTFILYCPKNGFCRKRPKAFHEKVSRVE